MEGAQTCGMFLSDLTYDNAESLTQNVHHGEAVVESEADKEAAQTELQEASRERRGNACQKKLVKSTLHHVTSN